jgi:hypothetical protein
MRGVVLLGALVAGLVLAASARASGPALRIGVAEGDIHAGSIVAARADLTIAQLAGFDSIRFVAIAWPGQTAPDDEALGKIGNVAAAARLIGMRVYLVVYNPGSSWTPATEELRSAFVEYTANLARRVPYIRDFIIGNEPNLNRFWLPQFDEQGGDVAAPAYLSLLSSTYDALKAVSPKIRVIGGALAPRGGDNPAAQSQAHSPSTFIRDLGTAYRESGRRRPVMDAFAIHPYEANSSLPPSTRNGGNKSIALADYAKLVRLLGIAFDGTAQAGSKLPIVYGEFGVEARIPAAKRRVYEGVEPASVKAVPERTQAAYYRQALQIAYCQPTLQAMFLFHLFDEKELPAWQSGPYYADRTPRRVTLKAIRTATAQARRGVLARCKGLALRPRIQKIAWPRGRIAPHKRPSLRLRCSIDCEYTAEVLALRGGKVAASIHGRLEAKKLKRVVVRRKLAAGRYRLRLVLVAPVNPGPPRRVRGPTFSIAGSR